MTRRFPFPIAPLFALVIAFSLGLTSLPNAQAAAKQSAAAGKRSVKPVTVSKTATAKKKTAGSKKSTARKSAATKAKRKPALAKTAVASSSEQLVVDANGNPALQSAAFLVQDLSTGQILLEKNAESIVPIASITKLMTAMVALDAKPSLDEVLTIGDEDIDHLKGTGSRLGVGTQLSREEMLRLALMSSENRAASALARNYPGGAAAFIDAMNRKAHAMGLQDTRFYDSTGLNKDNVSSARDLARMVFAASHYPLIREFSTGSDYTVLARGRTLQFRNTNALVKNPDWHIGVSKTGYINESGKCLVMQAWFADRPLAIVLLDSWGKYTRIGDAQRIRKWLERTGFSAARVASARL